MNERLRTIRLQKGWSQETAAETAQVSVRTYQRWEGGETHPNFESRKLLREAFGMTDGELGFDMTEAVKLDQCQKQQVVKLNLSSDEFAALSELIKAGSNMALFDPAKRKTLEKLATALGIVVAGSQLVGDPEPWERLSIAWEKPAAFNAAAFHRFEHLLGEGWELSNINELAAAEGILSSFLPKIIVIPQHEVTAQIAYLASHGLRLQSVLIHHRLQIVDKVRMCQQSVEYARHANDANTLVASLMELAVAYEYSGQMEKCLQRLQEALFYSSKASPLVQSRAYSKNAVILAANGRKREAELYIRLAHDVFPDNPMLDPGYALADSSVFTLSYHAGLVRLDIGQISRAPEGFGFYKEHPSGINIPERLRLEIVNGQSKAAILENNLDKYVHFVKDGLSGAIALGSKKRFDEAYTTFREDMPATWLGNSDIRSIAEQYHLRRG